MTLYRLRSWVALLAAIGASVLPIGLAVVAFGKGGKLLRSPVLWAILALFVAISAVRWLKAVTLARKVRALRDNPRLALRQEGLLLRSNGRHDSQFDDGRPFLLPWEQLEHVELSRKSMMQVLMLTGALYGEPDGSGQAAEYEVSIDYSQIELGYPLEDVADTIRNYLEAPRDRSRLPELSSDLSQME
jgi:hypothetical protein